MKYIICCCYILYSIGKISGQLIIDFDHTDLSSWISNSHWSIKSDGSNGWLMHSYNSEKNESEGIYLYNNISFSDQKTYWRFLIRHGYNPSLTNKWFVLLSADYPANNINHNLLSGYAIGVNAIDNKDILSFYRIDNGKVYVITESDLNWQTQIGTDKVVEISVSRTKDGYWNLMIDTTANSNELLNIGACFDTTYNNALLFGIIYQYSTSQYMKIWFDNLEISGDFNHDFEVPSVIKVFTINNHTIELLFSEPVDTSNIKMSINNIHEYQLDVIKNNRIRITFSGVLREENMLEILNISDYAGNRLSDTHLSFSYYLPQINDIIITEIMSSPNNEEGYYQSEFIEIYNRTDYNITLYDWQVCINNKCKPMNIDMEKKGYVVICNSNNLNLFDKNIKLYGVKGLNTLPNKYGLIEIKNFEDKDIHFVNYSAEWHSSEYKQEGGWSLESIDINNPCNEKNNWTSCNIIKGATPGIDNSVMGSNPDLTDPKLERISVIEDSIFMVHFSENLDATEVMESLNYIIDNDNPVEVKQVNPGYKNAILCLKNSLQHSTEYNILIQNLTDCAFNPIQNNYLTFCLPLFPEKNDIIINEVLFNEQYDDTEFIEIYNRSDHSIDMDNILIGIREEYTGEIKNIKRIKEKGYLLMPGKYLVFAKNKNNLSVYYNVKYPDRIIENDLPSLTDKCSTIVLCTNYFKIIDIVTYDENQHFSMLNSVDGVSLERINPEISSLLSANWHSASSTCGYATPGYVNSQYSEHKPEDNVVTTDPEVFTPDNDGINDVLRIHINTKKEGCTATIKVYNARGRFMCSLANNMLLGSDNLLLWNGINNKGEISISGIYIIFIRLIYLDGDVKEYKKICVLEMKY